MVICNTDNEEIKKLAHKTVEVPHQVDCLQGILTIIPIQLLSMHIAELRNCDVSAHVLFCVLHYCAFAHHGWRSHYLFQSFSHLCIHGLSVH